MVYFITGHATYNRKVAGVQFENGKAKTDNEWAAQWFSGRPGFSVEVEKEKAKKEK